MSKKIKKSAVYSPPKIVVGKKFKTLFLSQKKGSTVPIEQLFTRLTKN